MVATPIELPGAVTGAKYTSRDNDFRMEVEYDNDGVWHPYRRDRHAELMALVEAEVTPDAHVPPPEPVPQSVSAYQARMALLNAGKLAEVYALVAQLGPTSEAYIAWEYGTGVERNSPLMLALAAQLGYSDEFLDDLFRDALTYQGS